MIFQFFYLVTLIKRAEYIHINIKYIPDKIIKEYNLRDKVTAVGAVYTEENWGIHGLPQSGLLANQLLGKRINKRVYYQSKLVPGLWKQKW